ncbi:MAG: SRPBCC family protein [Bacteroidetes bacterium]|nr:SRPBCC family protein [Bacteroidota bacterium]
MNTEKITVEAIIAAHPTKVWDYYTQPEHITKWNFADPSWHCPNAENDLRVGGKYKARMEAKDGSFGFDFVTIYTHLDEGISMSYEMEDGRKADVSLEANGDTTQIKVVFDAENENPIELQKGGWQSILNNFKQYTEEN